MAGVTPRAVVALDTPTLTAAWSIVEQLGDACDFYKVGSELFTAEGPAALQRLADAGKAVFLDLKFHDIPATVRGAARSAAGRGARLITVHASGGRAMLEAAVEGAGDGCGVLGVTVLTSLDRRALKEAWGRADVDIGAEVLRLAGVTHAAGAHGVVCSGVEAASLHARYGESLKLVVPGVRLAGSGTDDQARVVRPCDAGRSGASYVLLGRTVTGAADMPDAMRRAVAELSAAG